MGSVKEYFKSLGSGVVSLVKGMQVTGKEFITPKITERYPEDRETRQWPDRFRAVLKFKYDENGNHKCVACGICQRNCPNGTITVETKMVTTPDGKQKRKLDRYLYDLGSCTFCQLCVTTCPHDAIDFSNDFEQAVFTRNKLVKQLNYLPEKEEPAPTAEELAKAAQERERKIEEAKAKAAALKAQRDAAAAAGGEAPATQAPAGDAAAKAAAAAAGDPEKEAKIKAALEKAARLRAEREAAKKAAEGTTDSSNA